MSTLNSINLLFKADAAAAEKAAKTMADAMASGLTGALGDAGTKFTALITRAHEIGSKSAVATMTKIINESTGRIAQAQASAKAAQDAFDDAAKKDEAAQQKASDQNSTEQDRRQARETASTKQRLQLEAKQKKETSENLAKLERFNFGRNSAKAIKISEENAKILEAANESAAKLMRHSFQEGGELIAAGITAGMTVSLDNLKDVVTKSFAIAATNIPQMAMRANESRAANGQDPSALLGFVTKLGPVLLGVGAALAGVVLLFTAAYGQTKEFNKAILSGATAIDIMGSKALESGNGLKRSLEDIRGAALQVASVTNQSTDDVIKMITSFNQAGVTLFELKGMFSKTGDATEAYTNAALFATTYTQALGVSVDELTKTTDDLSRNMGLGLDSIQDGFSGIAGAAQASGMNIKDFFTAVSQTTSGLALYNIRLSDTAASLVGLTKILGEKKAQEMLGAEGELGGQGFQEKYKTGMLVGKRGKALFQNEFASQSDTFLKDFKKDLGGKDDTKGILDSVKTENGEGIDAAKLAKLSGDDMGALQNRLSDAGNSGLARRLDKMQKAAIGAQGGAKNQATGFSGLSGMSDLAMRIEKGMSLLGKNTQVSELGAVGRMAFEEQSGISGEKFDDVMQIMNSVSARIKDKKIKDIESGDGTKEDKAKKIANVKVTREETLAGVQDGQFLSEEDRKKIEDATKPKETLDTVARKQLAETTDINATLKNLIAGILNQISGALTTLLKFMPKWLEFDGGVASTEDLDASNDASQKLYKDISVLETNIAETKKKIEGASPEDQVKLKEELLGLEGRRTGKKSQLDVEKKVMNKLLGSGGTRDDAQIEALGLDRTKIVSTGEQEISADGTKTEIKKRVNKTSEELDRDVLAANQGLLAQGQDSARVDALVKTATDNVVIGVDKSADFLKELLESTKKAASVQLLSGMSDAQTVAAAQGGDPNARKKLAQLVKNNPLATAAANTAGIRLQDSILQDFIYRGDGTRGTINPISSKDQFFGAKPGGPIDQAINGQGSRGGVVNIYVNGGDEARVYNVVKRVIQESGLRPPAGGR